MTKWNMVVWKGFWSRKETVDKNSRYLNQVWTLANHEVPILVH